MKRKNKLFYQTKIMHFKGNIIFIWSSFRLIFLVITDIIYFHRYRHVISRSIDIFCTCHRLFFNCYNFIPCDSGEGYSNECRTFRPRTFQPWTLLIFYILLWVFCFNWGWEERVHEGHVCFICFKIYLK